MNPDDESKTGSERAISSASGVVSPESDELLRKLDEKLAARIEAFRESERLSEEDFAIRINVRE